MYQRDRYITLKNIADLKNEYFAICQKHIRFKSWSQCFIKSRQLIKKNTGKEYTGIMLMKMVIREFFDLVLKDIILYNDMFIFPYTKLKIAVNDITNIDNKYYEYRYITRGKTIRPVVIYDRRYRMMHHKLNYVFFLQYKYRIMYLNEKRRGHIYDNNKYYGLQQNKKENDTEATETGYTAKKGPGHSKKKKIIKPFDDG